MSPKLFLSIAHLFSILFNYVTCSLSELIILAASLWYFRQVLNFIGQEATDNA
jgi:hypothetical protein